MYKYFLKNFPLWTTIFIIILSCDVKAVNENAEEIVCKSTTIRSLHDFKQIQNCTVVAGFVRIVELRFSVNDLEDLEPCKVQEISEYLLVYHVYGLDSLVKLFPWLTLIRGVDLLYDAYALAIVENRDMKTIGLVSLAAILRGSLRIESNPILCFVTTVDWITIMGNDTTKYQLHITNNQSPNQCPNCYSYEENNRYFHRGCWSQKSLQLMLLDYIGTQDCLDSSCLTGCYDGHCRHCSTYVSDRGCMQNCMPPKYRLAHKRKCVTDCRQYGLKEMGIECVEKCPKHYSEVKIGDRMSCVLNCSKDFVIHNINDLEGLADCTTINGSLTIEVHEMEKPIVQYLEDTFRNLNEITGYLKVLNSPQIVTLHFFENLHTVKGLQLVENRYSVYVVNNNYLQDLFWANVVIIKGCIYFHLNPRLCYHKITDLQKNMRECQKLTVTDVSEHSNGERVVCGEGIISTNATAVDVNSTAALIEINLLSYDDLHPLIGYIYYYREAPFQNVTKYNGRHGCGMDEWFTDTILRKQNRHVISGLKPGTQYAFFINSLTATDYRNSEHVSDIEYFTTLPEKPGAVAKLHLVSRTDTQFDLHWWPPIITNGVLEKYILEYHIINATSPPERLVSNMQYRDVCDCPKHHSESHVPTPHADKYFDREEYLYKDTVLNFIFKKKKKADTSVNKTIKAAHDAIIYARLNALFVRLEQEAIEKQESNKESLIILHPKPVCCHNDSNPQNQTEMQCVPLEKFSVTQEINSSHHSVSLHNLQPDKTYRFSLRACVKDLMNGCGPEKAILGRTVNKKMVYLLEHNNHK